MKLLYLEIALLINKKLYDDKIITNFLYEWVDKEIYKGIMNNGFI